MPFCLLPISRIPRRITTGLLMPRRAHRDWNPGIFPTTSISAWCRWPTGKFAEARKLADQAKKTAFTSRDRMIVAGFAKRVDTKTKQASSTSGSHTADAETQAIEAPPGSPSQESVHAQGRITELICGHPPEVVLTLATASGSLLLHIKDGHEDRNPRGPQTQRGQPAVRVVEGPACTSGIHVDARQCDSRRDPRPKLRVNTDG